MAKRSSTPASAASSTTPASPPLADPATKLACPNEGEAYLIDSGVTRAARMRVYQRQRDDPLYRPLKIFTLDPATSLLEGSTAVINVPYEPLNPGPVGKLFRVGTYKGWKPVDLEDPKILIQNGLTPSPSNPQFHQQMVYAVCSTIHAAFRTALGRHLTWGFADSHLYIQLDVPKMSNAFYDKESESLCFGYYPVDKSQVTGRNLPGGLIFTCLSHDIVAHELTHALLDGLRAHFIMPTSPDVLAFHEALADLVAIFHHFSYKEVLQTAIRKSGGNLVRAELLTDLATQFGQTIGLKKALRSAIDLEEEQGQPKCLYGQEQESHKLGSVLVSAVFEAFMTVFQRKTERYIRLATNGSGILPAGELHPDLQAVLAEEASRLAQQFLTICIRAIDFCSPVDLQFGEFLRAVITADHDLVPDDPWGYREAWIDAFRRRRIYPSDVDNLTEDALLWQPPMKELPRIEALTFANLRFAGDPACPADEQELRRQACALGRFLSRPEYIEAFGLVRRDDPRLGPDRVAPPCIHSIRSSRRAGPQGQILFDLVAEVTQQRTVINESGEPVFDFYGGATVIIDPEGHVRYTISKSVVNQRRLGQQQEFITSPLGAKFWQQQGWHYKPVQKLFELLHQEPTS